MGKLRVISWDLTIRVSSGGMALLVGFWQRHDGHRGAHTFDSVVSSLKLVLPISVEATSCGLNPETHPLPAIVTFQFPALRELPPVKLKVYRAEESCREIAVTKKCLNP